MVGEKSERLITWQSFERTYVADQHANSVAAPGEPRVEFYVEEGARRIGLRTPCDDVASVESLRLSQVDIRQVLLGGMRCLDFSTTSQPLFRSFFDLLRDIADRIQVGGTEAPGAIAAAVSNIRALAASARVMPASQQHGLFGELWILKRLLGHRPGTSLGCWTGPGMDPHDFRLEAMELEVKTRLSSSRIHTIHGFSQLIPTANRSLYVVSILLCASLDGTTLPEMVEATQALLPVTKSLEFEALLAEYGGQGRGYRAADAIHYTERLALRDGLRLVPIDEGVPSLTREVLSAGLGDAAAARVHEISYDVDFNGMGFADGVREFHAVLPPGHPS